MYCKNEHMSEVQLKSTEVGERRNKSYDNREADKHKTGGNEKEKQVIDRHKN